MAKVNLWMGHPILHPEDAKGLDMRAATLEFRFGYPREEAEQRALEEYREACHAKAAAHHLSRMKGAHAVGDMDLAQKHHEMYANHMQALGLDPNGAVPPKILVHGEDAKVYDFEPHHADNYLPDQSKEE